MDNVKTLRTYKLWRLRALRASKIHYFYSASLSRNDTVFSVLNIVSAILVLATINSEWYISLQMGNILGVPYTKVLQSIFGGLTVALSGVILVYRWGEKSIYHKQTGSNFSNLMKKIERYIVEEKFSADDIHNLYNDFCAIKRDAPIIPTYIYTRDDSNGIKESLEKIQKETFEVLD